MRRSVSRALRLSLVALGLLALAPADSIAQSGRGAAIRAQIAARRAAAGMTEEQIRAQLQQAGYSPNLLDAYLTPDTNSVAPEPSESVLRAVQALSLAEVPVAEPPRSDPPETQVFGLNVFRQNTSQFQPVTAGPVPGDYVIGPGDEIILIITGEVDASHTLPVTREGFIVIPRVGQIWVNGLTLDQLREQLFARLSRFYSGLGRGANAATRFDVSLGRLRTNQIFVTGAVRQPGTLLVSPIASVLNALYLAGGPTENGSMRDVRIVRGGRVVHRIDLYDYLLYGNNLGSIRLEPGDVLFVPPHGTRVELEGAVGTPALYELRPGETLYDLLRYAGGLTPDASLRRARLTRLLPPSERRVPGVDRTVTDIDLAVIVRDSTRAPTLLPGDKVDVFNVRNEVRNIVSLDGAVWQQGNYAWRPGMRVWDLIRLANGLTPEAFLERAQIVRLNLVDSTLSIHTFALDTAANGVPVENPPLEEFDHLQIFSRAQFVDEFNVMIAGEVRNGGPQRFLEGMTLRDLILKAGGLTTVADPTVEIARVADPDQREAGTTTQIIRVRLDSSYLTAEAGARYYRGETDSLRSPSNGGGEFRLQPLDRVFVRQLPNFEPTRAVHVSGEVRYPGIYALQSKQERLANVIQRAGGLNPTAFAEGFRFFRNGNLVNVELPAVLRDERHRDNLILQPGDSLVIPEMNPVVTVAGAVNSPSTVLYRRGASLMYYIENAGGFARNADEDRLSVRYANGATRVPNRFLGMTVSLPEPGPGSVVHVPVVPVEERNDTREFLRDALQTLTTLATLALVVSKL